jgi:hypothetical protein
LGVAREVKIDAFWEQTFATALAPAREGGASAFGLHPRTETVLLFASAFGWLIRSFHKTEKLLRRDLRAVTVGMSRALSISGRTSTPKGFASPDDFGVARHGESVRWRIDLPTGRVRPTGGLAFADCQRKRFLE